MTEMNLSQHARVQTVLYPSKHPPTPQSIPAAMPQPMHPSTPHVHLVPLFGAVYPAGMFSFSLTSQTLDSSNPSRSPDTPHCDKLGCLSLSLSSCSSDSEAGDAIDDYLMALYGSDKARSPSLNRENRDNRPAKPAPSCCHPYFTNNVGRKALSRSLYASGSYIVIFSFAALSVLYPSSSYFLSVNSCRKSINPRYRMTGTAGAGEGISVRNACASSTLNRIAYPGGGG